MNAYLFPDAILFDKLPVAETSPHWNNLFALDFEIQFIFCFCEGLRTSPELVLVVAGQSIHWSQGKCVLFDDSYLHLVRPSSEYLALSSRAVLMIDLWNINLTDHEREALKLMFPPC